MRIPPMRLPLLLASAAFAALALARKASAIRSVEGADNQTPAVDALFRDALGAGGFDPKDVEIVPVTDKADSTAYFLARWRGSEAGLKPLVVSGHLDVVEAKKSDWVRDPFAPIVE